MALVEAAVGNKVLRSCEGSSPHNPRPSPHSENAHSLRDETSLAHHVTFRQLGTILSKIRLGLVLSRASATVNSTRSHSVTPRVHHFRGVQKILSEKRGPLAIAHQPGDQELPGSSIHELPDRHIPTQELEEFHGLTELEGSPTQASQASYPLSNEASERVMNTSPSVLQPSNPSEDQMLFWNLYTQQPFATAPSMTHDGQSHTSSPISPSTPDVDGLGSIQYHSNRDVASSTVSPLESVSPYRGYWSKSHLVDIDCNYASRISLPTSSEASPVESFRELGQQSETGNFHMQQDGYSSSAVSLPSTDNEQYNPNNDSLLPWDGVVLQPYGRSHSIVRIPLGDYTYSDNLGWRYCGGYGIEETADEEAKHTMLAVSKPNSSQPASNFFENQQPSRKYIELYDHQDPELRIASRPDDIDHPLVPCAQCNKTFSGRYGKGNLRRHVLAFHNPLATVLGTACRVCKKAYRRADATRKHEWNKHQISDAKPKKRAK
ncbi:hypothetical protein CC77DRAFT_1007446 [Alternaria alternata]|uniref:C2H2-type domain-containing protein n=1 Tax=Alternaria alternata TaxID=5599 RepID=A0A177DRD5_ALTAL|nr:hypothetical protein CC77DRAFT_1007446 [Alternaria alternata]OAG21948.1 hypothetical protein CC77DRAFT_1007446 [Alternaria alternata]